jgi:hypothetical protein
MFYRTVINFIIQYSYAAANGLERKGEWREGKRIRWLDDEVNATPGS